MQESADATRIQLPPHPRIMLESVGRIERLELVGEGLFEEPEESPPSQTSYEGKN